MSDPSVSTTLAVQMPEFFDRDDPVGSRAFEEVMLRDLNEIVIKKAQSSGTSGASRVKVLKTHVTGTWEIEFFYLGEKRDKLSDNSEKLRARIIDKTRRVWKHWADCKLLMQVIKAKSARSAERKARR